MRVRYSVFNPSSIFFLVIKFNIDICIVCVCVTQQRISLTIGEWTATENNEYVNEHA